MDSTVTASLLPTATAQLTTQPPITQIIPILRATFGLLRALLSQSSRVVVALATPFLMLAPLISSLFAPITLIFHIILDAVIYTPYAIISSVTAALYPLYIFCAVACISGAALGIIGRSLITLVNNVIASTPELTMATEPSQATPTRPRKRRRKGSFAEDS
jgi:hypothetical protein